MGWDDRVGSIEPGFYADLVAVDDDPLEDIGRLTDVGFVMKGGELVVRDGMRVMGGIVAPQGIGWFP
jgi:imidazolonepropionase-like amidohydrolase